MFSPLSARKSSLTTSFDQKGDDLSSSSFLRNTGGWVSTDSPLSLDSEIVIRSETSPASLNSSPATQSPTTLRNHQDEMDIGNIHELIQRGMRINRGAGSSRNPVDDTNFEMEWFERCESEEEENGEDTASSDSLGQLAL